MRRVRKTKKKPSFSVTCDFLLRIIHHDRFLFIYLFIKQDDSLDKRTNFVKCTLACIRRLIFVESN